MDVLEVTNTVPCACHHTQAVLEKLNLVLIWYVAALRSPNQLLQILRSQISVVIDKAHHVLCELYHEATSVDEITKCYGD